MILTEFVFRSQEGREVKLGVHLGLARGVRLGQCGQQALAGVTEEADERLFGRVSAQGIRVTDLSLLTLARKVVINLMQDLVKERAMLMKTHPQFKAFERAMVGPGRKHRIADQPFDNEIVANLPFEFAQRPIVKIAYQQSAHQLRNLMGRVGTWPRAMMEGGAGCFKGRPVQTVIQLDEQVIRCALE